MVKYLSQLLRHIWHRSSYFTLKLNLVYAFLNFWFVKSYKYYDITDDLGVDICTSQSTPTLSVKNENYLFFNVNVELQMPIEHMPEGFICMISLFCRNLIIWFSMRISNSKLLKQMPEGFIIYITIITYLLNLLC